MNSLRALVILSFALMSAHASAWDRKGHAAVAALAEANLTPMAKAQVMELLRDDLDRFEKPSGRKTLASIASWPDEIRDEAHKTDPRAYAGWHTRSNQVCSAELGPCKDGHCVDQLIIHYAEILRDRSQDHRARNEALKWIVHLVGDEHQPLHSGINLNGGGLKAVIEGAEPGKESMTLHQAWDDTLCDAALQGWKSSAVLPADLKPLDKDAPAQWMIESRGVALHEVYESLPDFSCNAKLPSPVKLDAAYQAHSVPVIRHQIELAGLRLAQLLNELLAER